MMRKLVFVFILMISCSCVYAQKASVVIDVGYRNKIDYANWGLGAQFRYSIIKDFRLASDIIAYIPDDSNLGLDVGVSAQYLIHLHERVSVYPVAGMIISNHSFSADPDNRKLTELGFNFGVGAEFNISSKGFINVDLRYSLINREKPQWYDNYGIIRLGYGFRF